MRQANPRAFLNSKNQQVDQENIRGGKPHQLRHNQNHIQTVKMRSTAAHEREEAAQGINSATRVMKEASNKLTPIPIFSLFLLAYL